MWGPFLSRGCAGGTQSLLPLGLSSGQWMRTWHPLMGSTRRERLEVDQPIRAAPESPVKLSERTSWQCDEARLSAGQFVSCQEFRYRGVHPRFALQ
jgi:hypothetical protein